MAKKGSENMSDDDLYNGSPYFKRTELECKCCKQIFIDSRLLNALNALRALCDSPITVTCGYRCVKNNSAIGGAQSSYHCAGKAADIVIKGFTVQEMYKLAEQIPAFLSGGIGVYTAENFLHVDTRNGKARWARVKRGGPYVAIEQAFKGAKK